MGKSAVVMLVLVFLTASCLAVTPAFSSADVVENSWVQKEPMTTKKSGFGATVVNGKIYVISGYPMNNVNEMYDPESDTWTTLEPLPTARVNFGIAVYRDKIYVIGGQTGTFSPPVLIPTYSMQVVTGANEVYDPATNTWETKTPMPTPRNYLQANVVGGKIYLIGGEAQQPLDEPPQEHFSNVTEVYDPETDSWTTMASIPTKVSAYASAVVNDKIYIISGWSAKAPLSSQVQIFDPQINKWVMGKPIPTPVREAAAGATSGNMAPKRIYVFGGSTTVSSVAVPVNIGATQVYNPETDTWSNGTEMPTKRRSLAVAVVNDTLYALGGAGGSLVAANEQYIPFGYGNAPPIIDVVSPVKQTYNVSSVSLVFAVNKPAVRLGYSLDGQDNVTITGNTTISGLTSGLHNVTVYARDELDNTGASETITFSVEASFPTALVIAPIASVAVVGVGLLVYFRKRRK
ncbi:hypothetical protein JXA31_09825 [Candidatus Bathyarchaeota archaeon]|nr:hypothetical protein [Candidatus Bathyarchaeota archaeon]